MINAWTFLAGLGLFLYGMNLMEQVLKTLSGRSFKLFLRRYTQSLPKSIIGGAVITGLVQSSSVVSLLVLAFVESGIITFRNALGVILGSNLGTTFDSWIVASLGFKLDIESYALPTVAITAIAMFFVNNTSKLHRYLQLLFALGLLFFGLAMMKEGAGELVNGFDLSQLSNYSLIIFVVAGFVLTTVIQSSSATVAITLTGLHTEAIELTPALAIVIGSELGTTIKLILVSIKGSADKKRAAWGNFILNIVTIGSAYLLLPILVNLIIEDIGITDPLYGLVFFQTAINLLGIILFLPFIGLISRWLERRFVSNELNDQSFLTKYLPIVPSIALETLFDEATHLLKQALAFNEQVLGIPSSNGSKPNNFFRRMIHSEIPISINYEKIKKTEGSLLEYYSRILQGELTQQEHELAGRYVTCIRHTLHATKSIVDIDHDVEYFRSTVNDSVHNYLKKLQGNWATFDTQLFSQINRAEANVASLKSMIDEAYKDYKQIQEALTESIRNGQLSQLEVSTILNVEREVLSSKKSLVRATASLWLNSEFSQELEYYP